MAKAGKNTHLEHLEDEIINKGSKGGEEAIKILKYLGGFLTGEGGQRVAVTTKWDGAPAVICGTDPSDGQFFVGTKSVFAQDAKICKSNADILKYYSGALAAKLSAALSELKGCVNGVLQGDLMFTDDKTNERIDGENFITFRPNTITYAISPDTKLGREIAAARLGIVFHTKYTGPSLPEMTASFDVQESDFTTKPGVWIQRSTFEDIGGVASMTTSERQKFDAAVRRAEGSLKQTRGLLDKIQSGKKTLQIDTEFKKFFNNYVKEGRDIPSVDRAYADFFKHMAQEYDKKIKTTQEARVTGKQSIRFHRSS